MRAIGALIGVAIMVVSATGDLAGSWERNVPVMVGGILVGMAVIFVSLPKWARWVMLGAIGLAGVGALWVVWSVS